jgi:hypothetical protein
MVYTVDLFFKDVVDLNVRFLDVSPSEKALFIIQLAG